MNSETSIWIILTCGKVSYKKIIIHIHLQSVSCTSTARVKPKLCGEKLCTVKISRRLKDMENIAENWKDQTIMYNYHQFSSSILRSSCVKLKQIHIYSLLYITYTSTHNDSILYRCCLNCKKLHVQLLCRLRGGKRYERKTMIIIIFHLSQRGPELLVMRNDTIIFVVITFRWCCCFVFCFRGVCFRTLKIWKTRRKKMPPKLCDLWKQNNISKAINFIIFSPSEVVFMYDEFFFR